MIIHEIWGTNTDKKSNIHLERANSSPDVSALSCLSAVSLDLIQIMKECFEMLPAFWDSFAHYTLHVTEHEATRLIGQEEAWRGFIYRMPAAQQTTASRLSTHILLNSLLISTLQILSYSVFISKNLQTEIMFSIISFKTLKVVLDKLHNYWVIYDFNRIWLDLTTCRAKVNRKTLIYLYFLLLFFSIFDSTANIRNFRDSWIIQLWIHQVGYMQGCSWAVTQPGTLRWEDLLYSTIYVNTAYIYTHKGENDRAKILWDLWSRSWDIDGYCDAWQAGEDGGNGTCHIPQWSSIRKREQ